MNDNGSFCGGNYLYIETNMFPLSRLYAIYPDVVDKETINFYWIYKENIK